MFKMEFPDCYWDLNSYKKKKDSYQPAHSYSLKDAYPVWVLSGAVDEVRALGNISDWLSAKPVCKSLQCGELETCILLVPQMLQ